MNKIRIIQQIVEEGVVAILRGDNPDEVMRMAEHAIEGGIKVIELTMTVPFVLKAVEQLSKRYSNAGKEADNYAVIGVGTVLDPETARAAILSGAQFIVAPALNPATVTLCNRYRVPIMPGAMTVQEIQQALELGVDVIKLFPGGAYSPSIIKSIKGPLPQANLMPTGGVSLDNMSEWIKAGAVAVGIGSELTADAVRTGNYSLITERAAKYVEAYRAAKRQ